MKNEIEPNAAIEIHDSTLTSIESNGDDVIVVLSVYVHRSVGRPGIDQGTGYSQPIQLRFLRGRATGNMPAIPMELLDGRLVLSGETFENTIPMPLDHVGPSRIELESWNDARILIEGDRVTCEFVGPPAYVERFEP